MSRCRVCYGDGVVDANPFEPQMAIETCPRCDGSGEQDPSYDN